MRFSTPPVFTTLVADFQKNGISWDQGDILIEVIEVKTLRTLNQIVRTILIIVVLVTGFQVAGSDADSLARAKGIVLFIGDGMGINQLRSAAIYSQKVLGKPLAIDSIATRGVTTTHSANSKVTDSAAAATALYSGHKADNGAINILPDGRKAFTIGHAAKKAGLSVGVVSTSRLTDATPAAVLGHSARRGDENLIARQIAEFEPDVALGGGLRHFIPQSQEGSKRRDDKNLVEAMKGKGYRYVTTGSELKAIDASVTGRLLGLFAASNMAYELDRLNVPELGMQPDLTAMTQAALSILERNTRGFFVMIEGGRIDHACHSHDIKASIDDTLALDAAVKLALEYQKTHPYILVLVTADHETGGLGLGSGPEYSLDMAAVQPIRNSLEYLSKRILKQPAGLEAIIKSGGFDLTDRERVLLSKCHPETGSDAVTEPCLCKRTSLGSDFSWIICALGLIETDRARISWASTGHTAQPVITYASGPGEEEFSGYYDNTDLAKKMARLLGLALDAPASVFNTTP